MDKLKFLTLSTFFILSITGLFAQNDPTSDRWVDSGPNIITDSNFSGRIGIGVSAPTRLLSVFSPAGGVIGLLETAHPTGALLDISSTVGGDAGMRFQGGRNWTIGNDASLDDSFVINSFNSFPSNANLDTKKLIIKGDGNVGIGNLDPADKLSVRDATLPVVGISSTSGDRGQLSVAVADRNFSPFAVKGDMILRSLSGNTIINTFSPTGAIRFGTGEDSGPEGNTEKMTIVSSGDVGIGETSPDAKLHVNGDVKVTDQVAIGSSGEAVPAEYLLGVDGKVICEELKVKNSEAWPDYVFQDDYELMPLPEVAAYIQANNHLPNVPSASEVEKEGIAVGEMNRKLLEKVEELTLYLLEVAAENKALKARVNKLENQ